jgi:hypothetical protein
VDIVAVHDIDLKEALQKLGIYEELANGTVNCMICEENVNLENLGALMRVNGKIKTVCDKPSCFSTALKISRTLRE